MKKRTKQVFSFHHWLGLIAGTFLLISSITGSLLVFHHEIDEAQFADVATLDSPARELNIDNSFERILQLHPGADIRMPDFPKAEDQALKYEIRKEGKREWIFVHPQSGKTLATFNRADRRFVHLMLELHYMLLAGEVGKVLVLLGGVALFGLSISGLFLYRKSIVKVLLFRQRISLKSRRSFFSSLHRVVGVWSLLFNLLICVTGTWISFTIVQAAFSSSSAAAQEPAAGPVSIDKALNQLRKEHPEFEINYLVLPAQGRNKLTVLGRLQDDPAIYGPTLSAVQLNPATGEIDQRSFGRDLAWQQLVLKVFKPLHFGDFGGMGLKVLYAFFGIFPGLLAVSGFLLWCFRPQKDAPSQNKPTSRPLPARTLA